MFRPVLLVAVLTVVGMTVPEARAQRCAAGSAAHAHAAAHRAAHAALAAALSHMNHMLKGAAVTTHAQLLVEAKKGSKATDEIRRYLSNPAAWQKGLNKIHAVELGVAQKTITLKDGIQISVWNAPPLPKGWDYHFFAPPRVKGERIENIFANGQFFLVRIPQGVNPPPGLLP